MITKPTRFIHYICLISLFVLTIIGKGIAQEQPQTDPLLLEFYEVDKKQKALSFWDNAYWPYYFQRLDILEKLKGQDSIKLSNYYNLGFNMRYLGLPKESIVLYKQFLKHYESHHTQLSESNKLNFASKISHAYSYLADVYAKASYLDSASTIHQKNLKHIENDISVSTASALNNYGLFFYWRLKELDSALVYFNKSLVLTKTHFPEDILLGSIRDNIADVYVDQNQSALANSLYKTNFKFYKTTYSVAYSGPDVPRLISAARQSIQTDIRLDSLDSAQNMLSELELLVRDTLINIKAYPKSKLEYLQAKEQVFATLNKNREALATAKLIKQLSDSINTVDVSQKRTIENAINELTLERFRTQYLIDKQQKEGKIKTQRLKLWIISLTALIIIVVLVLLFIRRQQKITNAKNKQRIAEQDLELTALKNKQLNLEIESKQRDLSDFAINLTQNQEWAKELASKLEQLKSTKGRERKKLFDAFEQDVQNKITFDVDTKAFFQRLDKLSDAFYSELNSKFPDLSKTDKRLCSLIRLKIDSHEIATLQNITLSSLNTSRYRLRKKLNLSKDDDLDDFIQRL